jgi:hypothetical protein
MQDAKPEFQPNRLLSARLRVLKGQKLINILTAARHELPRLPGTLSSQTGRVEDSDRGSMSENHHHLKPNNHKYVHRTRLDHTSFNVRFSILTGSSGSFQKTSKTSSLLLPARTALTPSMSELQEKSDNHTEVWALDCSSQELTESKLFELRHWILQKIKHKLMNNPFFSLREFDNDKANPQHPNLEPQRKPKIPFVTSDEFVHELSSRAAETGLSPEHQTAIEQLLGVRLNTRSEIAVHECVRVICLQRMASDLFESRQGNELMQELLQHSELLCEHLTDFCQKNMRSLIEDELKTKTLYVLAKICAQFRVILFRWFSEHFETVLISTASVFLLISAFKVSGSAEEFRQITRLILSRELAPGTLLHKNFKRFMITYCEFCGEEELDQVGELLQVKKRIFDWLGDKYEALILSSFIRRKQSDIYNSFLRLLRFHLKDLYRTKFFKSLFFRLSRSPTPADVIGQLNAALLGIPGDQYCEIQRSASEFLFYVAMFVMTASLHQGQPLAAIAASIDNPEHLMRVFDQLPIHNITSFGKIRKWV